MRRIYRLFITLVATFTLVGASAQSVDFGGYAFNNDIVGWTALHNLSMTSHNYGTARSMGMGNAFTALGADMVSASLNPAGIGMYVDSDISLSFMLQPSKGYLRGSEPFYVDTPKSSQSFKDHNERFGMSSVGGVFTAYRGTKALTNVNVGFVYNRIADFNANFMGASLANPATGSIANFFCTQSNVDNLLTDSDGKMDFPNDPYYWGAVLAYKTGLTNKDEQGWFIDRIGLGSEVDQYSSIETRGSIGEYALTVGFNFTDRFYLGASLGIQSVNYKRNVYYGENYLYPNGYPTGEEMPYQVDYMNYMQHQKISGTGINLKLGATWRPFNFLRLGVAYHTPTYYALSMDYAAEMWTATYSAGDNPDGYDIDNEGYMYDKVTTDTWRDAGPYGWDFRSPSRLMFGAAITLFNRVIISADYERSWYQSTRLKQSPIANLDYPIIRDVFKGSNTVRVGGEFYLLPFVALRAGYIHTGSMFAKGYEDALFTHTMPKQQSYVTAGLGFKFGRTVYLDLAYQYGLTRYTPVKAFYAIDAYDPAMSVESVAFEPKLKKHIATVTLGFRF